MARSKKAVDTLSFSELFQPKLVTVFREGYHLADFRADVIAGLTVAIVALPLSIAIAIASGASPVQGLYTSIVGGFFIALLGGSRFQIGGPAGAFIIVVSTTVAEHGMDGLLLATVMSGIMLMAVGYLRLGTYIKFIPYPVTVGFTAGIAVIIFSSQLINMLGLNLTEKEPGPILEKLPFIWQNIETCSFLSIVFCAGTIIFITVLKKLLPNWPGMVLSIIFGGAITAFFNLDIVTIGSKFGTMPSALPYPHLPDFTFEKIKAVFPDAMTFTLLGAIESLLSAVVADGMTGRRHRSNCELVAQGVGNIASALFSGICVTGAIARTATNIRAGARSPISGICHSIFLLLFLVALAPLANFIPLACLAGILAIISWNMIDKRAISLLLKASAGDAVVLLVSLSLTIFRNVTEAIIIGFALGALLFIHRMSKAASVTADRPLVAEDRADGTNTSNDQFDNDLQKDSRTVVYHISGAFFFGAAASIGSVLDRIGDNYRTMILDFAQVPFLDATGANTIESLAGKAKKQGITLVICGASEQVLKDLISHGIRPPAVHLEKNLGKAVHKYIKREAVTA
ncbi:SulP family inorganic anion transporter [Bartonella sp. W8097]|uniref:SulP family inorganic anion transporter n=1 Tax=Bartonella apihabitans TaxID=2750929 RepID=UPI0018DD864C|nr:SulP family inorganic anion transporter [Bartonella apihabitans]MBI0019746.1 SulP family inorganic anion transporter [Bartonella apihabitans]